MNNRNGNKIVISFIIALVVIVVCLIISVIKNNAYNKKIHNNTFTKETLFSETNTETDDVTVVAFPRESTWGKIFDFNNEGITDNNYQAYTYDFTVKNNTCDKVEDFSFKLTFKRDVYLSSAWNGALEIHQNVNTDEIIDTVYDLREFIPQEHILETVNVDGESLIPMHAGDYLVYIPSSAMNAREIPIEPLEATTPGFIMYVAKDENIEDSILELEYKFKRLLTSEPLYWVSLAGVILWLIAFTTFAIISAQLKKYKERHEHDNVIISESIETFTGFIDAKDPYTNGHSKRVAIYTRLIAKKFGYTGDELDRIYYVALLHDCGKIGVPDNILCKPDKLTDEEFEIMKSHTIRGNEILSHFKSLENVGEGALYHHERFDGKGYPDGLTGEEIPFIARMICVADAFDAMNTNRVYRKKLSKKEIVEQIIKSRGRQFDPYVADVMLELLRENKIPVK